MGLLDSLANLDPNQTQGLLAAAAQMLQQSGPSRMPTNFGQILGGGLTAYNTGLQNAQNLDLQREAAKQEAQLRGLHIQGAQGELADQQQARDHAAKLAEFISKFPAAGQSAQAPAPAFPGGQSAASMMQGFASGAPSAPLPQAPSTPDPASQPMDGASVAAYHMQRARYLASGGFDKEANDEFALAQKAQPKYSTDFRTATGADGKLHNYVLGDDSTWKDTGLGVKQDVTEVDLGGSKQFIDKNTVTPGQMFQKTLSPDAAASNALGTKRLNFDISQANSNQDTPIDPLAAHIVAQQYLAGDGGALQNIGRGAQGAQNLNIVRSEIAKLATAQGMGGADIAARMAEFAGTKAGQRTAGTRSANIEIAATEAAQLAPLALAASDKVARSGLLPFGKGQVMFDSNTNDPNLRQFAMANQALVNAYGQVMSRGGVATVSDKTHAQELLSTAMDKPSYNAAVSQLMQEIEAARSAPKTVRSAISSGVSGRTEGAPAQQQTPAAAKTITLSDIAATARASGRSTADVTAAARAKGYTITGGQ